MHTRWVGLFPASYPGASLSRPELSVFVGARERRKGVALDLLCSVENTKSRLCTILRRVHFEPSKKPLVFFQ